MKRAFFKTAFVFSALFLWMVLAVPLISAMQMAFPAVRGPDGLYRNGDTMWLSMIPLFASGWVANRIVSSWFWSAGWSEDRWSLFQLRGARKSR
jgi:hypothetical protein